MKFVKFYIISIATLLHYCSFAQQIELGPISANYNISSPKEIRSTGIDSTFIYYTSIFIGLASESSNSSESLTLTASYSDLRFLPNEIPALCCPLHFK